MNKIKIFLFSIFYFLFSAPFSFAAGLVPCGGGNGEPDCGWCHLFELFKNLIDFALMIIFPIAVIAMIYGGILMMTAGGSESRFGKGKSAITSAVTGILIALMSWIILDTIFKVVAVGWDDLQLGPWNELSC